jgi:large subunit ribosomal protein L35
MPKMKTHRASAKRFAVSGSGKLIRRKAGGKHLLVWKSPARKNRVTGEAVVDDADEKRVKLALPYPKYLR